MTPVATHDHDPYGDEELEPCPLEWDSQNGFITMGDLDLTTEAAAPYQGSYWPSEPPVMAPKGYYWYDYGPLDRGMHYWVALPDGWRPSAAEQAAALAKHRAEFGIQRVPAGLKEALAQHGLGLEMSGLARKAILFGGLALTILGLVFPMRKE